MFASNCSAFNEGGGYFITEINVNFHSRRPERRMNCVRPTVGGIKKGGSSAFCDIANAALSLTILVVSIYTAKCHSLIGRADWSFESVGIKEIIVTMVVRSSLS